MTDRIKGCTVVFANDIREDDAQGVIDAIAMFKGVAVVTGIPTDLTDYMARQRVRQELGDELYQTIRKVLFRDHA